MNCFGRLALTLLAGLAIIAPAQARDVVDTLGRHVTVPDRITRVYATAPPTGLMVYAFAPETLIGFSSPYTDPTGHILLPSVAKLPTIGNMMGHGKQANLEEIMALSPDVVVAWSNRFIDRGDIERKFAGAGIPVVFLELEHLSDYPAAFLLLGQVFGQPDRAKQLADYVSGSMSRVQAAVAPIPPAQRVRIYYAESPDGLATDCNQSIHAEAFELAGAFNVYQCAASDLGGMEKISLEQVIQFAPDRIIAQEKSFTRSAATDARWAQVKAVGEHRMDQIPRVPFNWLDRPPSFLRALGIQWLAHTFYPQAYPFDLRKETRAFYQLFLHVSLSDADLDLILAP